MATFQLLESKPLSSLGVSPPTFEGASTSLSSTAVFVFVLLYVIIGVIAVYRIAFGAILKLEPSENNIRKSKEVFKKVVIGLLFVFVLPLALFSINKDLITGNVGLNEFGQSVRGDGSPTPIAAVPPAPAAGAPSAGNSRSCDSEDVVKSKLQSGGVCGGTVYKTQTG